MNNTNMTDALRKHLQACDSENVIANMQNTIDEQKALIEQMREGLEVADFYINLSTMTVAKGTRDSVIATIKQALALPTPVSEKAK